MVVQVDGGDAGGQDVHHAHRHHAVAQPVLLVEGAVAHLWSIGGRLRLEGRTHRHLHLADALIQIDLQQVQLSEERETTIYRGTLRMFRHTHTNRQGE